MNSKSSNVKYLIGFIIGSALLGAFLSIITFDRFGEKRQSLSSDFDYDISELRKTDPAAILYEEIKPRIDTGHSWGRALAVGPEDRIYTIGGKRMHHFSSSGERLPLTIEREQELTAITVLEDGTIYLGVTDHIEIYDAAGQLLSRWDRLAPGAEITSIAVTPEMVFAADFGSRSVICYDASGTKTGSFGDFKLPSNYFDIVIASDGYLYTANTGRHRIEAFDQNGNLLSWWGEYSNVDQSKFCGCCNPISFALLPHDGGFVTCEKGLTRVKVYDGEGNFIGFVAGPEDFDQHGSLTATLEYCYNRMGLDVAVDSQGRVLILDPAMAEIRMYQRKSDSLAYR
ncbi:MAG: hypothetical protein ACOX5R_16650 [bacterium]|jgi:hypothetical protein